MRQKRKIDSSRIFRRILIAAIFLVGVFLVFKLVAGGKWDGDRRFTIVVDGEPLLLFSIAPNEKQAILITIPSNVILDVPYGYSTYPAGAVWQLGNLDKKRVTGELLTKSIENTFGVVVEGFIASHPPTKFSFPTTEEKLINLKKTYFSLSHLLPTIFKLSAVSSRIVTNLSQLDILRLWVAIRSLRSDEITMIDIRQAHVLTDERLPDGTVVATINQDLLDQLTSTRFQDNLVRMQNVSLEVVNATETEKVASQFSRILQNLGANVVVKSTSTEKESGKCKVIVAHRALLSSIIVERLKKFYACQVEEGKPSSVADIKIVLGEGFIK